MLFTTNSIDNKEFEAINNFFNEFDAVQTVEPDTEVQSSVSKYLNSLVTSQYKKAVEDIENTKIGNKVLRKRNLQQVMQESFFYGANRFGNNFIA